MVVHETVLVISCSVKMGWIGISIKGTDDVGVGVGVGWMV